VTHRHTALALAAALALASTARAQQADVTLETAQRFLSRALAEARDTNLSSTRETAQVIAALRSARDKDLVPLFDALRKTTPLENQVYGMVSAAILAKDPAKVDVNLLLATHDPTLVGSAIATLIDADVISNESLEKIVAGANDPAHKAMAAGELNHRHALKDRAILTTLLNADKEVVRYYAAISLLESNSGAPGQAVNSEEAAMALATLHQMSEAHDLRQAPVQALMIVRAQKQDIVAACPWIAEVARDEKNDEGLRYTALTALLMLKNPAGPEILTRLLQSDRDQFQQIKLGLISLEFADRLSPGALDPLVKSKTTLAREIGTLAQQAAGSRATDVTNGIVKLLQDGSPAVLNWALSYSDRAAPDRRLAIRAAIINAATIVDDNRGEDYERAALAAQKTVEDSDEGRRLVASLLASENKAVVEACLAGIYRSEIKNQSALVLPLFERYTKAPHAEAIANYAALILAREGHVQALAWLPNMVIGSTVQNTGFRALAGWYYAKLKGQGDAFLKSVITP
jgi:hypothetical protein